MIAVKVIYDNGDFTTTGFNGTLDEAEKVFPRVYIQPGYGAG